MRLIHGDCLEVMKGMADKSVDLVLTDPPYGTTACKWDSVIPLDLMWAQLKRIIKSNGAIVLFGSQPFTSALIMSNLEMFKYELLWCKPSSADFVNAKNRPMKAHENIVVFSYGNFANGCSNKMTYNPQGLKIINKKRTVDKKPEIIGPRPNQDGRRYVQKFGGYPLSWRTLNNSYNKVHPTQKPVALMEYLIKTYSNEGETVLDFCMGSGTTGVACKKLNRNFIGIEDDDEYFPMAKQRIRNWQKGFGTFESKGRELKGTKLKGFDIQ